MYEYHDGSYYKNRDAVEDAFAKNAPTIKVCFSSLRNIEAASRSYSEIKPATMFVSSSDIVSDKKLPNDFRGIWIKLPSGDSKLIGHYRKPVGKVTHLNMVPTYALFNTNNHWRHEATYIIASYKYTGSVTFEESILWILKPDFKFKISPNHIEVGQTKSWYGFIKVGSRMFYRYGKTVALALDGSAEVLKLNPKLFVQEAELLDFEGGTEEQPVIEVCSNLEKLLRRPKPHTYVAVYKECVWKIVSVSSDPVPKVSLRRRTFTEQVSVDSPELQIVLAL